MSSAAVEAAAKAMMKARRESRDYGVVTDEHVRVALLAALPVLTENLDEVIAKAIGREKPGLGAIRIRNAVIEHMRSQIEEGAKG